MNDTSQVYSLLCNVCLFLFGFFWGEADGHNKKYPTQLLFSFSLFSKYSVNIIVY